MKKLSDLSRELPSEGDILNFSNILAQEESDRSAAIMAAGLTEQALYVAVTSRLADPGESALQTWFDVANAPFGTFAAKIKLGRALGVFGPVMETNLCRIKDIRNVFAHRSTPIDFTNPTIVREVKKFNDKPMIGSMPVRTRYCSACVAYAQLLIDDAFKHGGAEIPVSYP